MNYLGHLILSGGNEDIVFGNFIGDAIKGKNYNNWPQNIQNGITLHRFIDSYTDSHKSYLNSKRRFYESFPKMGGIITDILYDNLVWRNWRQHNIKNPKDLINTFYKTIDSRTEMLPKKMIPLYYIMKKDKWLTSYKHDEGIISSLTKFGVRIGYADNLGLAFDLYKDNVRLFNDDFNEYFSDIISESKNFIQNNIS